MINTMIKKEFRECLFESKGLWMVFSTAVLLSILSIVVVNIKEGSVLAQTDILQYAMKAIFFLTFIVSLVLGASSFVSEREENTMESLLLTPVSKEMLTFSKYVGVLLIGCAILAISMPYLVAIGLGTQFVGTSVILTLFIGGILELSFVAIAVAFSILFQSSKASILTSILVLILVFMPGMMSGLLKQSVIGRILLRMDPIANAFDMMKAVLSDQLPIHEQLVHLPSLVIFLIIAFIFLCWAGGKVSLKGEK
ncbi:MAG: ABC transporter permease [Hespellia sp.]|nr:ABC transporter permease [Hespellia sp.]